MKVLAHATRTKHNVVTGAFGLREMRRVYKLEGIQLDLWPHKMRTIRAAYFLEDGQPSVLLKKSMKPVEPRLFALAHELKHHLVDQDLARSQRLECAADFSSGSPIEIGAEIFAAEFIFPEDEFVDWLDRELGKGACGADEIVRLKRQSPAKVSYAFIVKRLEWLGRIQRGAFKGFKFQNHEHRLYGVPFYLRLRRIR
ncbi:MAG TPA: ImmA/IrrE family metallo-endopeptidase [Planctomycetota bacterium]|nr:ImmA/IrrE family metallo-endopeptidase [Planctomycetota bacterium]